MVFKNSISISVSNFNLAYKVLVYMLIILVITCALGATVIVPVGNKVMEEEAVHTAGSALIDRVEAYLSGEGNVYGLYGDLKSTGKEFIMNFRTENVGAFVGVLLTLIIVYVLYKFLIALCFLPTSDILNKFMSSNMRYGFTSNLVLNIKRSAKYALARILFYIPTDFALSALVVALVLGLSSVIGVFAFPIVLVVAIVLYAARETLFSGWLPRLIHHPEEGIWTAFKNGIKDVTMNEGRGKRYQTFVAVYAIYYIATAALGVATFGVILIIGPAIFHLLTRSVEMVDYYSRNSVNFYTDRSRVVNTTEMYARKDLFNDGDDKKD